MAPYKDSYGPRKRKPQTEASTPAYTELTACRSCSNRELADVFSLGEMCINAFPKPSEPDTAKAPLTLCLCAGCSLLQLRHTVSPDSLFKTFFYRSATTSTMRAAMKDIVACASKHVDVRKGDLVADIGANDGTLLRYWPDEVTRIGFEPAENLRTCAKNGGNIIVSDYFSARYMRGYTRAGKAKVITAAAMLYDVSNLHEFLTDVCESLADDGIFVCQFSYLPAMLDTNDVGNIVHEHVTYLSLTSTKPAFERAGLHVYDVEFNAVNGGSIRIYASRKPRGVASIVDSTLVSEAGRKMADSSTYAAFGKRCADAKAKVLELVEERRKEGEVYILAASTKGQVTSQYYGFTKFMIGGASERDPRKVGLEMVGSRIPIVDEETARMKAKTFVVMPFHFRDEIINRERAWLAEGGRMIFCQPQVTFVGSNHMGTPTITEM